MYICIYIYIYIYIYICVYIYIYIYIYHASLVTLSRFKDRFSNSLHDDGSGIRLNYDPDVNFSSLS